MPGFGSGRPRGSKPSLLLDQPIDARKVRAEEVPGDVLVGGVFMSVFLWHGRGGGYADL